MIEVRNLTKRYGAAVAVRDASFRVEAGEIVGFLGPNGAGKTTTIRMLTGFLPATSGSASVDGHDVFREPDAVRERIGYLPENVPLYGDLRVREFLAFRAAQKRVAKASRTARIDRVVERCGLRDVREQVIATLSRGFRQRVGLADALLAEPPVLILDEPTSGFDPLQRIEMRNLIVELAGAGRTTVLFSSHILSEVQAVSKRLLVISRGAIVADGRAEDLMARVGGNRFRVAAAGDAGALRGALSSVAGIASFEEEPGADIPTFVVHATAGHDPREAIFDVCAKRGIRLRELAADRPSLEVLFARLVSGVDEAGAAAA